MISFLVWIGLRHSLFHYNQSGDDFLNGFMAHIEDVNENLSLSEIPIVCEYESISKDTWVSTKKRSGL